MSSLEVGILVTTVIGFIPLYADLVIRWRERHRLNFLLLRFHEGSDKPIESSWSIRILHPEKAIEKCSVSYDSVKLPWWDKPEPYYENFLYAMGGGNVRIPKGTEKENATVVVRDNKKIIRKKKFKDIPIVDA
jgi:hypothetical protein